MLRRFFYGMFSSWRLRSRNDLFTKSFQKLVFLAVIVSCTACAQTGIRGNHVNPPRFAY